jgi:4-hydroxy-tetrahydrodipicolinate synthase
METVAAGTPAELIQGVYAAVLTPRTTTGALDEDALRRLLELLLGKGIRGFAVNGATGEFCRTTEPEFARLMGIAAEMTAGRANFVAGIGSGSVDGSIRLGRVATEAGAAALLLPMPYFFPYAQEDLKEFVRAVAAGVDAAVLLYNLPQFTSRLEPATSVELVGESPCALGIKDSSGSLETVRILTAKGWGVRLIGNDGVLAQALEERVLDGVVSGVACVLPELILRLYAAGTADCASADFRELAEMLRSFIERIRAWPTPWGLKIVAEARGLGTAEFPMPLSSERAAQKAELLRWFADHRTRLLAE